MIYLLQPSDGVIGAGFKIYDPISGAGLLFSWRSPDDLAFRDFVLQISDDVTFATITHTALVTGEITTNPPTDNVPPVFYGYIAQDLLPNKAYFWRVGHNNAGTYENFSNISVFYTSFEAPTLVSAVGDVGISGQTAHVSWAPVTDPFVDEIVIKYGASSDSHPNYVTLSSNVNSVSISSLPQDAVTYFVAVVSGTIDFDYQAAIAPAGLESVIVDDGRLVITDDENRVII